MSAVYVTPFDNNPSVIRPLLAASGLADSLMDHDVVIVKPNLVEAIPPPVTTRPDIVGGLLSFIRSYRPDIRIIIAEGVGTWQSETDQVFRQLGYDILAQKYAAELLDLNTAPCIRSTCEGCFVWPEMILPEILFDSFVISVPALKAHSLASVTLSMKNMMGVAPHHVYGKPGAWRKAKFHEKMQESVFDLNHHRAPDFVLMDASVGMAEAHLYGPTCNPPVNRVAASQDPVSIDAWGAVVLGKDPRQIGHIALADGGIGSIDFDVIESATA